MWLQISKEELQMSYVVSISVNRVYMCHNQARRCRVGSKHVCSFFCNCRFIILSMVDILTKSTIFYKFSQHIYLNSIIFFYLFKLKLNPNNPTVFNCNRYYLYPNNPTTKMVGLDFKILNLGYAGLSILNPNPIQPDRRSPLVRGDLGDGLALCQSHPYRLSREETAFPQLRGA